VKGKEVRAHGRALQDNLVPNGWVPGSAYTFVIVLKYYALARVGEVVVRSFLCADLHNLM
jgi:hypothetical protein